MKNQLPNNFSQSSSIKESDKIHPSCIYMVSSTIKELENKWNKTINNNNSKKNIIQSLFSLLSNEILLIQQISQYYNLYLNNLDQDNLRLIHQTININKELMDKKINTIINSNLYPTMKKSNTDIMNMGNQNLGMMNMNPYIGINQGMMNTTPMMMNMNPGMVNMNPEMMNINKKITIVTVLNWDLIFEEKRDGKRTIIRICPEKTVGEAIRMFKIKKGAGNNDNYRFIYNGEDLALHLKINQSGLSYNSVIDVYQ